MTDIVERLRAGICDDPCRVRDIPSGCECAEAAARIEQLEAENASLASWQCEFTDGKTGLVYGAGGSTYCAMAKEVERLRKDLSLAVFADNEYWQVLEKENERLRAALERFACTCDRAGNAECSSGEVDCPFWQARAALEGKHD